MKSGLTHTICPTCRRRMGAKAYAKKTTHAVLSKERRGLFCKWCKAPLALLDDEDKETAA